MLTNNELLNEIQKLRREVTIIQENNQTIPYDPDLINSAETLLITIKNNMAPKSLIEIKYINGISQRHVLQILTEIATSIISKTVTNAYDNLRQLFKDCITYGYKFSFTTDSEIENTKLPPYNKADFRIIKSFKITST